MRLLLLAPRRAQTGNGTTARRIQDHLEAAGHLCILKDSSDYESPLAVSNLISSEKFEAALGIHLFKAGRLLQGSAVPFGIIFGGTDINEDAKSDEKARVMGKVLDEARFAVSFTEAMKEAAATYWPQVRNKICIQAQGIVTLPNRQHNWTEFLQRAEYRVVLNAGMEEVLLACSGGIVQGDQNLYIFLLICGLRRVKDPLYLLDAFSEWHQEDSRVHLIIIGPAADPPFAAEVEEKVNRWAARIGLKETVYFPEFRHRCPLIYSPPVWEPILAGLRNPHAMILLLYHDFSSHGHFEQLKRADGVHLLPEVPQEDLHAVAKKCFAIINTSTSEGMSAAILEAMDLNVPVLARNIPGNAAVIVHQTTGLLYSTPQEFVQLAKTLVKDPFLRREIVRKAREYVLKHHSWEKERKVYQNLVLSLC